MSKPVRQFRFSEVADDRLIKLSESWNLTRTKILEHLVLSAPMKRPAQIAVDGHSTATGTIVESVAGSTFKGMSKRSKKPTGVAIDSESRPLDRRLPDGGSRRHTGKKIARPPSPSPVQTEPEDKQRRNTVREWGADIEAKAARRAKKEPEPVETLATACPHPSKDRRGRFCTACQKNFK